jgi:hypothetical protein
MLLQSGNMTFRSLHGVWELLVANINLGVQHRSLDVKPLSNLQDDAVACACAVQPLRTDSTCRRPAVS